ncbi:MAG: hypothetical protein L3J98_00580 [Gammaproteobacteria bacterium]|nr:hypothetical protein [Gammaproteobacteria bacterium]MCF6258649.1 hypothetical protein [Gammaproteobacteria bacterium]
MGNLVCFLEKWQSLVGAIIGGIFALMVALLVAYKAKRHEDVAAAMLVVANLVAVKSASNVLSQLSKDKKIGDKDIPYWYSEKLVRKRLQISPLFEAYRIRLMPISVHLASHLEMFQMCFNSAEDKLNRLSEDYHAFDKNNGGRRNVEIIRSESKAIYREFEQAALHACCAEKLITKKILSKLRMYHLIRSRFMPTKEDKLCMAILRGQ